MARRVDCLVNNAGFGLAGRFAELDGPRQRAMIDLNCGALTELAHAVLPGMIGRKAGKILNVASTAAFQPGPGMAVYFATKAFVLSFSEALHEEVRRRWHHGHRPVPRPDRDRVRRGRRVGARMALVDKLSATSADVVRAGIAALDKGQAVVDPRAAQQGRRAGASPVAALGAAQGDQGDEAVVVRRCNFALAI